jgi:hypothetical protein
MPRTRIELDWRIYFPSWMVNESFESVYEKTGNRGDQRIGGAVKCRVIRGSDLIGDNMHMHHTINPVGPFDFVGSHCR